MNHKNIVAFNYIYERYYSPLIYYAQKIIAEKEEAGDIVSTAFTRFWQSNGPFESEPAIKTFLYITVRNACFNYLKFRKRQAEKNYELGNTLLHYTEQNAEQNMIHAGIMRRIHDEIERLPAQCRNVFKLLQLEGKTPKEVAAQLNISINTVGNQKARALQLLRKRLSGIEWLLLWLLLSLNNNNQCLTPGIN